MQLDAIALISARKSAYTCTPVKYYIYYIYICMSVQHEYPSNKYLSSEYLFVFSVPYASDFALHET